MNSAQSSPISDVLEDLHRRSQADLGVFLRALPSVASGLLSGRSVMEAAKPHLRHAYIPIDPTQGRALYQIARARGARRIVEFGTSFGISTLYLAAAVRDNGGGKVITTEMEPLKIEKAAANFRRAGLEAEIELRPGDALQTLRDVEGPIDLLFLDGWKEACLPVLRLLEDRLGPGSCILCDDMRAFRKTLKAYVEHVRGHGRYASLELPLGDGLEFTVVV